MAAQSGVWFYDERSTEGQRHQIDQGLRALGFEDVFTETEPGIAIGSGDDHLWAEEWPVRQPLRSDSGLVITWDGRLDNRDDLLLRLEGRVAKADSDARIAMAVLERWGLDGLRHLIGDWSLVAWSARTRTLHFARDYMGVRPLYYHVGGDAVTWSTSLGELATRTRCADDLNDEFVARFMSLQLSTDVTPYKGIRGVPPTTCVSLSADGVETRRHFWMLEPGRIRYRHPREYEEHLRALWSDAVASRLRIAGTVWAELSGGLDSSSVVCMADALIAAGRVSATGVQPISHVTLNSPEGDERRFIAEVEQKIDRRSEILGVEAHDGEYSVDSGWISPFAPGGVRLASAARVYGAGGRVVLSGRVGDVTMGCTSDNSVAVLDDFVDRRIGIAASNVRRWSRATRKPYVEIAWALARTTVSRRGRVDSSVCEKGGVGLHLLSESLRSQVLEQHLDADEDISAVPRSHIAQARQLLAFGRQARLESWPERGGVAETHPFTHRPLVEFMCAVPAEELSAPGNMRALMRRAFVGLVPDRVLRRVSKGYYPPAALRATRERLKALPAIEQLESVSRGWIDSARLRIAIRELGTGETDSDVQLLLTLERWLALRHRRGPAVIPRGKEVNTNDVRIA